MKISLNIMKQYGGQRLNVPVAELVEKIGAQLGAVEEVVDIGQRYDGIVVAKVVTCENHPNADRLHVCTIDDDGVTKDVTRNDQGYVEVVCGAPNVRAGLLVAWLPPGVTVPSTIGKDDFVLEARDFRGVVSNGMLASPKELNISDNHDGILEIDPSEAQPGKPFKELYALDDTVIDIENKMFTHRPDCFGQLGVSREVAGIQNLSFTSPSWYANPTKPTLSASESINKIAVTNEIPDLCPRYMLVAIDNVKIGPSPLWLQAALSKLGVRSINNIVDITNYMMLVTGQPLHAFDFDKVAKNGQAHIIVRKPHEGEKLGLLDGRTIVPRPDAILICDDEKPIAMGGMMGCNNSEIDEHTQRILIECATFDMYNIRRSSMEHGIFTDAVTRFTKGQSPWQCPAVLYEAIKLVLKLSPGAEPVAEIVDDFPKPIDNQPVTVTTGFINERLGTELDLMQMQELLQNVEFRVETKGDETFTVTAPFWRADIAIPEDIVEEVGRLHGFDHLPLTLPKRDLTPPARNQMLNLKQQVRQILLAAGANEVLTYSFVHGNLFKKSGQSKEVAFQLSNALSPDLQYFRLSLTPSLLEKVHPNIKSGYDQFALFEIGKGHMKDQADKNEPDVPMEMNSISLVFAVDDKAAKKYVGSAYFQAAKYLRTLLANYSLSRAVTLAPLHEAEISNPWLKQLVAPFEPNRSALIIDQEGHTWGVVGEYKASVRRALKLPSYTAGFEVGPLLFFKASSQSDYHAIPRFPKVSQDLTLRVPTTVTYAELEKFLGEELDSNGPADSYFELKPLSIYQKDESHKNVSFRLEIASYERTLTDQVVNELLDGIAKRANEALQAERV